MTERASSAVCCGESGCCDTGVTLPSTLIAGGKPAVMKRSDPFLLDQEAQQVVHELGCLVSFHDVLSVARLVEPSRCYSAA